MTRPSASASKVRLYLFTSLSTVTEAGTGDPLGSVTSKRNSPVLVWPKALNTIRAEESSRIMVSLGYSARPPFVQLLLLNPLLAVGEQRLVGMEVFFIRSDPVRRDGPLRLRQIQASVAHHLAQPILQSILHLSIPNSS